jgi:hypothetical protein
VQQVLDRIRRRVLTQQNRRFVCFEDFAIAGVALTASMVANKSSTITPLITVENFFAVAIFCSPWWILVAMVRD